MAEKTTEKKTRKPREANARKVEEIIELAESKLTEKEKENLIKFLKTNVVELGNKVEALDNNIRSTREQLQQMQRQYNEMEIYYKNALTHIDTQTKAFADVITRATYGGLN